MQFCKFLHNFSLRKYSCTARTQDPVPAKDVVPGVLTLRIVVPGVLTLDQILAF